MLDDLAALPRPEIIETLSYEDILAARKAQFTSLMAAFGLPHDVIDLETDPATVLIEEASYEEVILRARGNDIARARYLYFATGSALDHMGTFYDCARMTGEADDRYKQRIILAVQSRSTGGSIYRYKAVAMAASLRVADAVVYRSGVDPTVNIAVFAADNNGVADTGLIETVALAVNADDVRMVSDTIAVRSAVVRVVPIVADMVLLPNTATGILDTIGSALPQQWISESGLGRDLTADWIKARLMVGGIYSVALVAPSASVIVNPYEAVRIGAVTLRMAGRAL